MEEERKFQIGLFRANSLHDNGNGILCYTINVRNYNIMLECNKNDNSTRMLKRTLKEKDFTGIDEATIALGAIKILSEDGSRWEGDWYNEKLFGFGSIYDGEDNRIYSGFMFEGKKIGYGTEYFADNHKVDYCGNFINNERHGWGITYDRNGQKLFEGDWRFGSNVFEDKLKITKMQDCLKFHDMIKELEFKKSFHGNGDLVIENASNLEKIILKSHSLQHLDLLKICNCEKLKTIETEWTHEGDGDDNVKNVIIRGIRFIILLFISS